jgi:hypothetical protein
MKQIPVALACMFLLSAISCTPFKIYSDPAMSKPAGFKFYTAKPFVQVEKDSQTDAIVKATVLYLPDLTNPQYLTVRNGWGSQKIDISLNNGIIEKIGLTSDTKIPESIEALAATVSKSADAIKDLSGLKGLPQAGSSTITELYEVIIDQEKTTLRKIDLR